MASYSPRKSIIFEIQRCHWRRWNDFRGVIDIGTVLYKYLKQKKDGGCPDLIFGFSGVNDTAETDFGDFRSDYLGEYDDIYKTGLAC
jgi:hypothetical protein